jgi:hypothetical protein
VQEQQPGLCVRDHFAMPMLDLRPTGQVQGPPLPMQSSAIVGSSSAVGSLLSGLSSPSASTSSLALEKSFLAPATHVLPHIFLGGERDAQNPDFLTRNGVTHVLNLTNTPSPACTQQIAKCLQIPLADNSSQDILNCLPTALAFMGK